MGILSAEMLAEVGSVVGDPHDLLELETPGGTLRFGVRAAVVAGVGFYESRVLEWGPIEQGISLKEASLELPSVTVRIDDTKQTFAALLEGADGYGVRGSVARFRIGSPNVPVGSWHPRHVGRIVSYVQPAPSSWDLSIATDSLPLQRETLGRAIITRGDFPDADPTTYGRSAPIIYGRFSSVGGTEAGAVPAFLVDSVGFVYLVAAGWLKSVDNVYVDGVLASSGYAITHPVVNGRVYTCIDFTTTQGTSAITCDVQGYEPNGDGSGAMISDPAEQVASLVENWSRRDYRSGALVGATSGLFNSTWATSYFADRTHQGALYVDSKRRGVDVLNDWLETYDCGAFWESDGTISLEVLDPSPSSPYVTDPAAIIRENELGDWRFGYSIDALIDRIDAEYSFHPAAGAFTQYLTVEDIGTGEQASQALELRASPAFIT